MTIPIIKIRRSHDRLIFMTEIHIPQRRYSYWNGTLVVTTGTTIVTNHPAPDTATHLKKSGYLLPAGCTVWSKKWIALTGMNYVALWRSLYLIFLISKTSNKYKENVSIAYNKPFHLVKYSAAFQAIIRVKWCHMVTSISVCNGSDNGFLLHSFKAICWTNTDFSSLRFRSIRIRKKFHSMYLSYYL